MVDAKPWWHQWRKFPYKLAAIKDLDADFLIFRRYGWLHNYALLYLQDELVHQQDELETFDKWEHTEKVLEHPTFGSQVIATIRLAIRFITKTPDHARTGKARFDGSTRDVPYSTAQPSLSSRDLYKKHPINVDPPLSVRAVATEPTQTTTSLSTPSVRSFSYSNPTIVNHLNSNSLASCAKPLWQNGLGYLLALSWIIAPAFAAEDSAISTPQPGPPWPLNQGPPSLWDSLIAITIAIIIIVFIYSTRKWPWKFQESVLWALLLGFCTFGGLCIMGDATTSLTNLLSIGALQVYFGQHFARMPHRMPHRMRNRPYYTMSVHFWLPIFALTVVFALLCMKASPTMYSQNVQLPWFPFTIPCFGMSVILCVYLGYLWNLLENWVRPLIPQFRVVLV